MKKNDNNREVLALVGELMRKFYEDNDFSSFTQYLASEVVYIPIGNKAPVTDRDSVEASLMVSSFFACKIENEDALIKKLDGNFYIVSHSASLSSKSFTGIKRLRANLVINRKKDKSFEIVYISFSKICEHSTDSNIFPVEKKSFKRDKGAAREELLIDFLLEGLNNKDIAKRLSLAEITIKKALSKIYQRFGVKNRGELVAKISKRR